MLSFEKEPSEEDETKEEGIRHWTVILGENGAGKSAVLRAIALVTAGSDALRELLGEPRSWVGYHKKFCEIEGTLATKAGEERKVALRIEKDDSISRVIKRNSKISNCSTRRSNTPTAITLWWVTAHRADSAQAALVARRPHRSIMCGPAASRRCSTPTPP